LASPLSGLRILVLEDEALIAFDVEQLCLDNGAREIVIAGNLHEAASIAAGYDAAVIDVMLDGEPTLDFARELRARRVPFIFASGYDDLEGLLGQFPGVVLVSKPYAGDDLVNAIAASLERRHRSADG
jgi:DNA-binding response OmpR family regulator